MLILLVHGLGRTPLSLLRLAAALRSTGHSTRFFAYWPTFEPLDRIVRRLTRQLDSLARGNKPIGLLGHSLGGLLLRLALDRVPEARVHRLVMLGTPNGGSRMARLASRWLPFRLLTRECGRFLATPEEFDRLPPLRVPTTIIAGTSGPRGRFSPFGNEVNDGLVSVAEAALENAELIQLPALHTFMMDSPDVRERVLAAFRE
jgi:pimeloyl-ACP methyl ester carboxylesterase